MPTPTNTSFKSRADAEAWLQKVVDAFVSTDVKRMEPLFDDSIVIRVQNNPELKGRPALINYLTERFSMITDYRLKKVLRSYEGDSLGVELDIQFTERATGNKVDARALEILELKNGKITVWEQTTSPKPAQVGSAAAKVPQPAGI